MKLITPEQQVGLLRLAGLKKRFKEIVLQIRNAIASDENSKRKINWLSSLNRFITAGINWQTNRKTSFARFRF